MPIPTNEPVTVWSGKDGEYATAGPFELVDTPGLLLVDTSGLILIDSGIIFNPTPTTVWSANDGV